MESKRKEEYYMKLIINEASPSVEILGTNFQESKRIENILCELLEGNAFYRTNDAKILIGMYQGMMLESRINEYSELGDLHNKQFDFHIQTTPTLQHYLKRRLELEFNISAEK